MPNKTDSPASKGDSERRWDEHRPPLRSGYYAANCNTPSAINLLPLKLGPARRLALSLSSTPWLSKCCFMEEDLWQVFVCKHVVLVLLHVHIKCTCAKWFHWSVSWRPYPYWIIIMVMVVYCRILVGNGRHDRICMQYEWYPLSIVLMIFARFLQWMQNN